MAEDLEAMGSSKAQASVYVKIHDKEKWDNSCDSVSDL
jgi:hypothetical protein